MIITGLGLGGAEMMLYKLLERADRRSFSFHVLSLTSLGDIGPRIAALGWPVHALEMRAGTVDPRGVASLYRRLRQMRPDVVHTWMYHADLVGGVAARLAGVSALVWGIRNSTLQPGRSKWKTRLVVRLNALLSRRLPAGILSCSEAARDVHVALGYAAEKMTVVPNGFDLSRFRPDPEARSSVRAELGLSPGTPLVGLIGRFDPQKNHAGFLRAAGLLKQTQPAVRFVLAGAGLDAGNPELLRRAQDAGVSDAVFWLGQRDDMPRLMASLDVLASSSSYGEAFPNVIGEAMACGVPCAVTDVGDSGAIVGDTGRVVSPGDMPALAAAISALLSLNATDRASISDRARARIQEHFEIGSVVRRYEDYYRALACGAT